MLNRISPRHYIYTPGYSLLLAFVFTLIIVGFGYPVSSDSTNAAPQIDVDSNFPAAISSSATASSHFLPIIAHNWGDSDANWYMAGANPQRTSWVSEQVDGNLSVEWYRPIEAYVDPKSQIIAVDGILYLSTTRGLYAFYANDPDAGGPLGEGDIKWRFDTELPLGHSPTVVNGVVYIGGYDKKMRALDAATGQLKWVSDEANGAFEGNPIVVNGKVFAGNRDGSFYAYSAQAGNLLWNFKTGGAISQSAAYDPQTAAIYFASNDMYAYALNAANGNLLWKSSEKLPGESFRNYWPVIHQDYVVFLSNTGRREGQGPGGGGIEDFLEQLIYPNKADTGFPNGALGPTFTAGGPDDNTGIAWPWADGTTVMDMSYLIDLLRDNPYYQSNTYLNKSSGTPLEFPAPFVYYGNRNGELYPPVVMPNGVLYQTSTFRFQEVIEGVTDILGWYIGTPYVSLSDQWTVMDEPQEISGGGNRLYRRRYWVEGSSRDITFPNSQLGRSSYWSGLSDFESQAPGWNAMMHYVECSRFVGFCYWYGGSLNSINGHYMRGRKSPLIPHQGKLYMIDNNALLAFSPQGGSHQLPPVEIIPVQSSSRVPSTSELTGRLDEEIQKILEVYSPGDPDRFLKPGYYNDGQSGLRQHDFYFRNPGETLYTLSLAYPHVSESLKDPLANYLLDYYQTYFVSSQITNIGWEEGTSRNAMRFAPEVQSDFANFPKSSSVGSGWTWRYPQINIYALWKYAQINPDIAQGAYEIAKSVVEINHLNDIFLTIDDQEIRYVDRFEEFPFELQGYVAGYLGFLGLNELVGSPAPDSTLKQQVEEILNEYLDYRYETFTKDTYWYSSGNHQRRHFNVARNFMWLVPEVGTLLCQNIQERVLEAIQEYNYVAPFWFLSALQVGYAENLAQHLFNPPALFQAKAWILNESRGELYKYLDVPVFERGDLFYIQNLIAIIEAPE